MNESLAIEIAAASPTFRAAVPNHVLLDDAVDVANAVERRWAPTGSGEARIPGLSQAGPKLGPGMSAELLALVALGQSRHADYLMAVNPRGSKPLLDEANTIIDHLGSTLEWAFDDGAEDEKDAQLAAVRANDSDTTSGRALDLGELVELASRHLALLTTIPLFEVASLDRGRALVGLLRELPPPNTGTPEAQEKLALRSQVFAVIDERVKLVRRAARFVFGSKHPAIVREFTSSYERRRRTALNRAKAAVPAVA